MFEVLIGLAIGFIVGIFVYRNNKKIFNPICSKIDGLWDETIKKKYGKEDE